MQKKILKRVLLAILALIVVLASLSIFAYSRYIYPTGEIMPNLYAVRNYRNRNPMVNFFIKRAGEKYIVFDTGSDSAQTENALQQLGISASDVVAVFLTHSDWDHIGSLDLFYNATLYTGITDFQYARRGRGLPVLPDFQLPDMPHITMLDGDTIELYGRLIQCFHTAGHTSDSVSFLVDSKYLFVGDLLVNPRLAYYNEELQTFYIERMLSMEEVSYVFSGHFGLFRSIRFFRWWWL
ncbi:MAG: MBL fold metallo-hydrolase [Defluviitaleaceae bacterium]|nr:MBL fold metallo-hydrolase [Defluviitaleaceae bacterium]